MYATVIVALVCFCLLIYLIIMAATKMKAIKEIGKQVDRFQGLEKHWLYGTIHHFPGYNEEGILWSYNEMRKNCRIQKGWIGPFIPYVVPYHPEVVRLILKTSAPKQRIGAYHALIPWLGDGLLLSSGEKWFRNRRLLTPAFHFDVLKPYVEVYNQAVDILLEKWENETKNGESIDICQSISLMTLNTILRCAFSYDMDVQRQGDNEYVRAVNELSKIIMQRSLNVFMYWDWLFNLTPNGWRFRKHLKILHDTTENLIKRRKHALSNEETKSHTKYLDFLDILLLARDDNGEGLTHQEIKDETDTFLFEGHDTTASAIQWILYTLACHPDEQERCRQEALEAVAGKLNNYLQWEDLSNLPYTTQCIKEAMRIHSPVPLVGRVLKEPLTIDGITLLPGTHFDIAIYCIHHNPMVWGENHMDFIPERFDIEKAKNMDPYAFIPFSAGPRNCIGQNFAMNEIKVAVCRILQRFRLRVDPNHVVEHSMELVMRAANGIKLFLEPV